MSKIRVRLIRVELAESEMKAGCAAFVHLFQLIALIEQEGDAFAGCIQGFEGSIEAVGENRQEVIQNLVDGFSLTIDYHIGKDTLPQFLEKNRISGHQFSQPIPIVTGPSGEEPQEEVTFVTGMPGVVGGFVGCAT